MKFSSLNLFPLKQIYSQFKTLNLFPLKFIPIPISIYLVAAFKNFKWHAEPTIFICM